MSDFFGLKIVQSPLCEMRVPVRKHKKRRSQSASYHARIQKKWSKRFGYKTERVAFIINPSVIGLQGRETIIMHPKDFAMIRNFT